MGKTVDDEMIGEAGAAGRFEDLVLVCTNDALRRATRQLGMLYDETFAPSGLKATQFGLLIRIEQGADGEGPTLQTVADRLGVGISALTHALRPLVRDDLVALQPDARDKRAKRATLTPLGHQRLQEGRLLWAEAHQRVETLLGIEGAQHLRTLAERLSSDAFACAFKAELSTQAGGQAAPTVVDLSASPDMTEPTPAESKADA